MLHDSVLYKFTIFIDIDADICVVVWQIGIACVGGSWARFCSTSAQSPWAADEDGCSEAQVGSWSKSVAGSDVESVWGRVGCWPNTVGGTFTPTSFSCYEICRSLESIWTRNISTVLSSFQLFLHPAFCSACEVTCVIIGHFERFCYLPILSLLHVVCGIATSLCVDGDLWWWWLLYAV